MELRLAKLTKMSRLVRNRFSIDVSNSYNNSSVKKFRRMLKRSGKELCRVGKNVGRYYTFYSYHNAVVPKVCAATPWGGTASSEGCREAGFSTLAVMKFMYRSI